MKKVIYFSSNRCPGYQNKGRQVQGRSQIKVTGKEENGLINICFSPFVSKRLGIGVNDRDTYGGGKCASLWVMMKLGFTGLQAAAVKSNRKSGHVSPADFYESTLVTFSLDTPIS